MRKHRPLRSVVTSGSFRCYLPTPQGSSGIRVPQTPYSNPGELASPQTHSWKAWPISESRALTTPGLQSRWLDFNSFGQAFPTVATLTGPCSWELRPVFIFNYAVLRPTLTTFTGHWGQKHPSSLPVKVYLAFPTMTFKPCACLVLTPSIAPRDDTSNWNGGFANWCECTWQCLGCWVHRSVLPIIWIQFDAFWPNVNKHCECVWL